MWNVFIQELVLCHWPVGCSRHYFSFQSKLEPAGKCRRNHEKVKEINSKPHNSSFPIISSMFSPFSMPLKVLSFLAVWKTFLQSLQGAKAKGKKAQPVEGYLHKKIYWEVSYHLLTPSLSPEKQARVCEDGTSGWLSTPCVCAAVKSWG